VDWKCNTIKKAIKVKFKWDSQGLSVDEIIQKAKDSVKIEPEPNPSFSQDEFKICAVCGEKFYKRIGTSSYNWRRSKYCSRKCQYVGCSKSKKKKFKYCKVCGKSFSRKPDESNRRWLKRSVCSRECSYKLLSQTLTQRHKDTRNDREL
jgi:hypothetical protein